MSVMQMGLGHGVPGGASEALTSAALSDDGAWTWFSHPESIAYNGKLYAGAVRSDGDIWVASWNPSNDVYVETELSAAWQVDDHANPTLLVRGDGKLMVFFSKHNDSRVRYRVSTNAEDISAWDSAQEVSGVTYAAYNNPFYLSSTGRIYHFYRGDPGDGVWSPCFVYSDDDGATWSSQIQLFEGPIAGERPYPRYVSNGTDRVHVFVSAGHPTGATAGTNDLFHFYLDETAGEFRKSDGTTAQTLATVVGGAPLVAADLTKVYDATDHKGGATDGNGWPWSIVLDGSGRPVVAFAVFSAIDDNRYAYAYWDGSQWVRRVDILTGQRSLYGAGDTAEDQYAPGLCVDPRDVNRLYVATYDGTDSTIERWTTADNGQNWSTEEIDSSNTVKFARPVCPKDWVSGMPAVLYMRGTYTTYSNYSTDIYASPQISRVTVPVNTVAPVISGDAEVDATLSCTTGTWSGGGSLSYAYQWKRSGVNIGGATSSTYVVQVADEGTAITCAVTATNAAGNASQGSNTINIPGGLILEDTFTDADATTLQTHTGETGATWTKHPNSAAGDIVIQTNRASDAPQDRMYYASGAPGSAEYDVEGTIRVVSVASNGLGVCARMDTTASTFYMIRYNGASTRWELFKRVAGTFTSLGTWTEVLGVGDERTFKLEIRDAAKKLYVDSGSGLVERISSADNVVAAAGRIGFRSGNGNASTSSHVANLTATPA